MGGPGKVFPIRHGFDIVNIVFIYLLFAGNSHQVEIAFQPVLRAAFVSFDDFCKAIFRRAQKIEVLFRPDSSFDRNGRVWCRIVQYAISFRVVVVIG